MATSFIENSQEWLRTTRVWTSIFRRGPARTNRTRSLAIFGNLFLHVLPVKVRDRSLRVRATYYLGSISFFLLVLLVVTGTLLMLYYHPAVPQAYLDMKDLKFVVSNGVFLRNLHRVAANFMIIAVFAHLLHVFYRGGYRPPHEFNWVVGVVLLLLTLFLSYTGYLLPWDQLAFWAITVGTNIISAMPFLGRETRFLLLGGNLVGENALLRFYVLHCVILPLLTAVFVAVHFWRIQKDGGLAPAERPMRENDGR
jgi:quinol-cytochrome oxidoreductase complex cytochrome b subunit